MLVNETIDLTIFNTTIQHLKIQFLYKLQMSFRKSQTNIYVDNIGLMQC